MSKLMSTNYTTGSFNIATLLLRLCFGVLLLPIGYNKLVNFATYKKDFMNLFGIGQGVSLGLVVFAELLCAALVVIGLFTRFAAIPVVIVMIVALFVAHHGHVFTDGKTAAFFLTGYLAILLVGPGRISVDGMTGN